MYAVFEDGSRQYRVSEGDVVRIDYREAEIGSTVELNSVVLAGQGASIKIGQPYLAGAKVVAEVLGEHSDKLQIQHFRRRKNYRRLRGHTQTHLDVKIKSIVV
ncbi:50S ribosomal protein L21 [Telmatocola sphagniphila]|jgi:large subunit ribosomal protein L21|uniref:Large ribosomal subunit protein bL21 n=1 Tax=Telmatocola sphagniphila TaxID=1123043 RepID=A0A8E6B1C5_9BACT|nr:50S ribosomal protein L21 [Telmatocola sphagniphila]QVL29968.1 50S ribosomal protein L21 [Telmatocola sphagniphila]